MADHGDGQDYFPQDETGGISLANFPFTVKSHGDWLATSKKVLELGDTFPLTSMKMASRLAV